jgi:hypothetical protein
MTEEDDDDDLEDSEDQQAPKEATIILNLSEYSPGSQKLGALAVSQSGRFLLQSTMEF